MKLNTNKRTLSLKQRLDANKNLVDEDRKTVAQELQKMNEKLKGLDNFFYAIRDSDGRIVDVMSLSRNA